MTLPNTPVTVRIVGMTDVGLVREHNEDNFLVIDLESGETDFGHGREVALGNRGALLVVCDGMGGAAAGEVASHMAVEVMRRELRPESGADATAAAAAAAAVSVSTAALKPTAPASEIPAETSAARPTAPASELPADSVLPATQELPAKGPDGSGPADPNASTPTATTEPAATAKPEPSESTPTAELATIAPAKEPAPTGIPTKFEIPEPELHGLARKLRIAVTKSNQEIYEAACADIAKAGMGTTATSLLLLRSHVIVAQVGDSRAYMWRKGKLTQVTHDQSLVNQLLDSGQITAEQAKLFEHSNVILQALGVQEDVEVVLSTEVLRRDDRLLVCSDGLVGVVSDEDIQDVLTHTDSITDAARRLIELARAGGGPDNITVIVAQISNEVVPPPAPEDEVHYRPLYLDGEKPADRRIWAPEYGLIGQPMGGRDPNAGAGQPNQVSKRMSVIATSAVLALLLVGLVGLMLLYKPQSSVPTNPPALQPIPTLRPLLPPVLPPLPAAALPGDGGAAIASPAPAAADAGASAPTPVPPLPPTPAPSPVVTSPPPPAASPTGPADGAAAELGDPPKKRPKKTHKVIGPHDSPAPADPAVPPTVPAAEQPAEQPASSAAPPAPAEKPPAEKTATAAPTP
jgi:serine/threonine protein phosphatase PrpC